MSHASVSKLTATMVALLFIAGLTYAMADDTAVNRIPGATAAPVTNVISGEKTVMNYYNNFGVCYSSTEHSSTTTQTTLNGQTSTTVSESTSVSSWVNGSMKTQTITGTSTTTNGGVVMGTSNSTTTYSYNAAGALTGASGTTTSSGTLPDGGGEYTATTVDTYDIQYGQAIRVKSVTNQTTTVAGQTKQTSTDTTTYDYDLIGGSMRLMGETSVAHSSSPDGSSSDITTTKTYSRDGNGVCTGISQTKSGSQTAIDSNGGTWTSNMDSYDAEFAFDEKVGWHIVSDEEHWTDMVAS